MDQRLVFIDHSTCSDKIRVLSEENVWRSDGIMVFGVSSQEIGQGSDGTTVFEGYHYNQPCAVKRLVRGHRTVDFDEINHMLDHERHPNIVRYWKWEIDRDFMFLGMELCNCSLYHLIQALSISPDFSPCHRDPPSVLQHKARLASIRESMKGVNLWIARHPSPLLLKLMREVVSGLGHLHDVDIVHRDLKPQNILITGKPLVAKLSDVGIIKCLAQNSEYHNAGWQAPELLLHGGRVTPTIDMFSLGCVLFFCITRGGHPFGEPRGRDVNIGNNTVDLSSVAFIPEAHDLISRLLSTDPKLRPQASKVLHHPFFWSSQMRLSFLHDVSNRVELEAGAPNSRLLKELEKTAPLVFGESWDHKVETKVMNNLRRHGAYDVKCVRDLLRVVRDSFSRHLKAPKQVKKIFRSVPDGLNAYFAERYPALLMESYRVLGQFCKKEEGFREYFQSLSSAKKGKSFGTLDKKQKTK